MSLYMISSHFVLYGHLEVIRAQCNQYREDGSYYFSNQANGVQGGRDVVDICSQRREIGSASYGIWKVVQHFTR